MLIITLRWKYVVQIVGLIHKCWSYYSFINISPPLLRSGTSQNSITQKKSPLLRYSNGGDLLVTTISRHKMAACNLWNYESTLLAAAFMFTLSMRGLLIEIFTSFMSCSVNGSELNKIILMIVKFTIIFLIKCKTDESAKNFILIFFLIVWYKVSGYLLETTQNSEPAPKGWVLCDVNLSPFIFNFI